MLNCVDGCIPSDLATETPAEIEEERRLLYVAMTRARDALHLITPLRFYIHGQAARGDKHVYAARSRFLPDAHPRPVRARQLGAAGRGRGAGSAADAAARPEAPDARHVGVGPGYFTAPAESPPCQKRWMRRKAMITGTIETSAPAATTVKSTCRRCRPSRPRTIARGPRSPGNTPTS